MAYTRKDGSLSADLNGWCMNADIAVDPVGALYAVWKQDYTPSNDTRAEARLKRYSGGAWTALGGGIGFTSGAPVNTVRLAMLGSVPYLAWGEASAGIVAIHVGHWDGAQLVHDVGAGVAGAVADRTTDAPYVGLLRPAIANVGGTIMLAYFRDLGNSGTPQIAVKTLSGGVFSAEATITGLTFGDMSMCLDLAVGTSNPWLMLSSHDGSRAIRLWERISPGTWVQRGGDLRNSTSNRASQASLTVIGNRPYVALAEGAMAGSAGEMGGPDQVYVKHWDGANFVADGGSRNVSAAKHAGRPALGTDGTDLWLAHCEGARAEKAKLYTQKFTVATSSWAAAEGPHNADANYSADSPRIAAFSGVANVIWTERASGATKQVYVAGTDGGTPQAPAAPSDFGPPGTKPTLVDNQWQYLTLAKGGVSGVGVCDEGFSSTYYSPGLNKTIFFGKYHNGVAGSGEEQNALLMYDFPNHRVDLLEIADGDYSEHLHAHGHDAGNYCYDTTHDLLMARGALSLVGVNQYRMYAYDPIAGRGKRMMPTGSVDSSGSGGAAAAFDRTRDQFLLWNQSGDGGVIYSLHTNAVIATVQGIPGQPIVRGPGITFDHIRDVFIMVGGTSSFGEPGSNFNSVWTLPAGNPTAAWTTRTTTGTAPSPRHNPNLAFDLVNGVVMVASGRIQGVSDIPGLLDTFILNPATWTWSSAGNIPDQGEGSHFHGAGSGNMMVYDSGAACFLLRNDSSVDHWYRYKYDPSGIPARTWVSRLAPARNQGPHPQLGGKHGRMIIDTLRQRPVFIGGDYDSSFSPSTSYAGAQLWPLTFSTWVWTPALFRMVGTGTNPVPSTGCTWGVAYDSRRDQMLVAGGFFNPVWAVTAIDPAASPRTVTFDQDISNYDGTVTIHAGNTHGTIIIDGITPNIQGDFATGAQLLCVGAQPNTFIVSVQSPSQVTVNKPISGSANGVRIIRGRTDSSLGGTIATVMVINASGVTGLNDRELVIATRVNKTAGVYLTDATDLTLSGSYSGDGRMSPTNDITGLLGGSGHGQPYDGASHSFAFVPTTGAWILDPIPPPLGGVSWGGDGGSSFSVYDAPSDQLIKAYSSGFYLYSRGAGTVPTVGWAGPFLPTGNHEFNWAQTAIDPAGKLSAGTPRAVYIIDVGPDIDPHQGKLVRFNIDARTFTYFTLPADWARMNLSGGNMLVMDIDTINRKLAIVNPGQDSFGGHAALLFFDLDTQTFEPNEVAPATVDGFNVAVNCIKYDPFDNAFVMMGRSANAQGAQAHWVYRYTPGAPPPPPPPPTVARRITILRVAVP